MTTLNYLDGQKLVSTTKPTLMSISVTITFSDGSKKTSTITKGAFLSLLQTVVISLEA